MLGQECVNLLVELPDSRLVLSLDRFGHERGGRRGDRTALALEFDILEPVAIQAK